MSDLVAVTITRFGPDSAAMNPPLALAALTIAIVGPPIAVEHRAKSAAVMSGPGNVESRRRLVATPVADQHHEQHVAGLAIERRARVSSRSMFSFVDAALMRAASRAGFSARYTMSESGDAEPRLQRVDHRRRLLEEHVARIAARRQRRVTMSTRACPVWRGRDVRRGDRRDERRSERPRARPTREPHASPRSFR